MNSILQDVRYVLRALANRPVYALVTVLVLALALGANTTVFSVYNGLFLRPMPYPDGERLVAIYNSYPNMNLVNAGVSIPDYLDRRAEAPSLEDSAIYTSDSRALGGDAAPERLLVTRASPSLFGVLGVGPLLGRVFDEQEAVPGADRVAVLSHGLWTSRFGRQPDMVGRDIELDGERYRVVGVMPQRFGFPNRDVDVWVPFAFTAEQMSDAERGMEFSESVGRLRPGATVTGLNGELDAIVKRSLERLGERAAFIETSGFTGRAELLRDAEVGPLQQILLVLQGIVLAVLLIACANVTNLQLARIVTRHKELAVRAALGASRVRLARLVLIESLVLASVGAVAGLAFSVGGLELVRRIGLDRARQGFEFAIDPTVVGFTCAATLVAAMLAGLVPLYAALRTRLAQGMHEAGRLGGGGRAMHRFRAALVVFQIAASAALLVGAGLLTKSFYLLVQEGPGFDARNVWTAQLALPENSYDTRERIFQFHARALDELRSLPGVTAAGFTSTLPFSGNNWQGSSQVEGFVPREGEALPHAQQRVISEGYLPALAVTVIEGRNFDAEEAAPVALVDENMARRYWPGRSAVGQRVRLDFDPSEGEPAWHTIVGVVPAIKQTRLSEVATKETIYWHYQQIPIRQGAVTLRSSLAPDLLAGALDAAVHRVDPGLPLFDAMPMAARVERAAGPQRAPMVLALVFAAGAFVLAIIGIYGVLTWAVTQRVGEIGVRMALGARARDIARMILGQGGRLITIGLLCGVLSAVGLGRVIASQIYQVSALDPTVFAIALFGLGLAALLASWVPAYRAARIEPMRALRAE